MSLLKVLQELLRPWYKSASNHKPNRPLKRKYTKKFRLYITVKILEAVGTTRAVTRRNLGNSEDLLDRTWRAQSWQSTCQEARRAVPSLLFVPVSRAERRTEHAPAAPRAVQLFALPAVAEAETRAQALGSLPWLFGCGLGPFWFRRRRGVYTHSRCKSCPDVPWCSLQSALVKSYSLRPWFHTHWPLKLRTWLRTVCILALCIHRIMTI